VAVDDRSTDATGPLLDRLALSEPRLRVLHVTQLPPGWLGKTHALHAGSQVASGEYLLFTDADVHFDPQVLRRAIAECERAGLDHLVVLPQLHVQQSLLAALLLNMQAAFYATLPPWKLRTSRHVYVGLGAFNLVRAPAYRRAGGHAALRLEVVDDLLLGKRLKQSGARQELVLGEGAVALEWYRSAGELTRGLEKNSFASVDYSIAKAVAITVLVLLVRVWPMAGLLVTSGAAWWLNAGTVAANLLGQVVILRKTQWPRRALLWWPVSAFVLLFILWRGVVLTLRRGGIVWRGTVYPVDELRAARRAASRSTSP
jgi:glycosyltransferase involved in cell wall biosynthesis